MSANTELRRIVDSWNSALGAPRDHYHQVSIKKANGKARQLSIPCARLRKCQRAILRILTKHGNLDPAAVGGVKGTSPLKHARSHVGRRFVLTMDLKGFFDTVHHESVCAAVLRITRDEELARALTDFVTFSRCLPQGAPTSMFLGNLVLFGLDRKLRRLAARMNARYTRYVDDLAFSSNTDLSGLSVRVEKLIVAHRFRVNDEKTILMNVDVPQVVSGLIVNRGLDLSETLMDNVLALRGRYLGSSVSTLRAQYALQLQGYVAFCGQINPDFASWVSVGLALPESPTTDSPHPDRCVPCRG